MSHQVKWEDLKAIHARYRQAARPRKPRILDECCQVSGDHRKSARRLSPLGLERADGRRCTVPG